MGGEEGEKTDWDGRQTDISLQELMLLEQVWPCWVKCVTVRADFEGSYARSTPIVDTGTF